MVLGRRNCSDSGNRYSVDFAETTVPERNKHIMVKEHYVEPSEGLKKMFANVPVLKYGEKPQAIIIGKFRLVRMEGGIWIGEAEGGEGGRFKEEAIEAAIEKFYAENF